MSTSIDIVPDRSAFPSSVSGPRVAVLAYDGLCTFEFGVAYEVFGLPRPEMGLVPLRRRRRRGGAAAGRGRADGGRRARAGGPGGGRPRRRAGQAQFIASPVPRPHEAARLGPLIDAMRERPGDDHRLDALAARAGMSLRTFHRRFAAATGLPPGAWLLTERLRLARELLERPGALSMDAVAEASGFGTAAALRHHFRARLGTSPAAYRKSFGGEQAGPARPAVSSSRAGGAGTGDAGDGGPPP